MSKSIEAIREALAEQARRYAAYPGVFSIQVRFDAAAIAELLAERDAALSRASEVEAQTIERCALVCEAEHLEDPQDKSDDAYDLAIKHCAAAIRSMRPAGDGRAAAEADPRSYSEDGFDLTPTKFKD